MRTLFCTTGTAALGETFTAAQFAKELLSQGHECYFIAPKLGSEYLQTLGFGISSILVLPSKKDIGLDFTKNHNYIQFTNFLKSINPDFIIVADWWHFKENGDSPNITYSLDWLNSNIKLGTFDHLGFAPQGIKRRFEKLPFQINNYPPLPERYSFIIRPCPHHDNINLTENNIYYWSIYNDKLKIDSRQREDVLYKYNGSDKVVIIHPVGIWQQKLIEGIFKVNNIEVDFYYDLFMKLMFNILSKFDNNILYFFISGTVKEESVTRYNNITLIKKPPLKHDVFMDYLAASDIFITDNISSSNLSKAIFNNKIAIVYKNSLNMQTDLSKHSYVQSLELLNIINLLKNNNLLFPYLSFPIGLNELEDMYINNTFSSTFIQQELFDLDGNYKLFDNIFNNESFRDKLTIKQNKYISNNSKLLSAEEILLRNST